MHWVGFEINGVEQLPKTLALGILVLLYIGYMVFDVSSCTRLIKRKNSGRVMAIIKESVKSILNFVIMILFAVNSFSKTSFVDAELSETIAEVIIFAIMCFIQISIKIAIILYYIKTKKYFE